MKDRLIGRQNPQALEIAEKGNAHGRYTQFIVLGFGLLFFAFFAFGISQAWSAGSAVKKSVQVEHDDVEQEPKVKIRLIAEKSHVKGGERIWIGIEQSILDHWHTYWFNPGDSGSVIGVDWSMPDGFDMGDIQWPVPKKLPYGPLLNYGYEDNVVLLQELQVPETLPKGALKIEADIDILVCKDICIPEYGAYTITLNDPDNLEEYNHAFFENAHEKLPKKPNWPDMSAVFSEKDGAYVLDIDIGSADLASKINIDSLVFYPQDWGVVQNTADAQISLIEGQVLRIVQPRGYRSLKALDATVNVLRYQNADGQSRGLMIEARKDQGSIAVGSDDRNDGYEKIVSSDSDVDADANLSSNDGSKMSIGLAFLSALLGGLVLNLMPCVFPVLSMKALSLVKISEKSPSVARLHGLSYTAGVVLSFLVVAGVLIALQAGGSEIGWGFQLQNAFVVSLLALLLFVVGLNLAGFFEFSSRFSNVGNKLTQGQGLSSSFFTGILATIVATPCTAPFMAPAIGFALVQPAIVGLGVFAALGLGLALPYLALSFLPNLQKIMPCPGAWMDRFKEFLAFPMFASSAWLVWVVSQQSGPIGVLMLLMMFTLIGFIIWLMRTRPSKSGVWYTANQIALIVAGLLFIYGLVVVSQSQASGGASYAHSSAQTHESAALNGQVFSHEKLAEVLKGKNPIFVEMTAAWCITCKVNHVTSINIDQTKKLFMEQNVEFLVGDWTNQDPQITKYLKSFGRNGVPIYVFYGAPDENGKRPKPELLPQILTPGIVAGIFE